MSHDFSSPLTSRKTMKNYVEKLIGVPEDTRRGKVTERIMAAIVPMPKVHPLRKIECSHCGLMTLARDMDLETRICCTCSDYDEDGQSAAQAYELAMN